jgi:hypothetical protein
MMEKRQWFIGDWLFYLKEYLPYVLPFLSIDSKILLSGVFKELFNIFSFTEAFTRCLRFLHLLDENILADMESK